MSENAKNKLSELLKNLGHSEDYAVFQSILTSPSLYRSNLKVTFPNNHIIQGSGEGKRKLDAEIAAAQVALNQVHKIHREFLIDWEKVRVEAQAGDALIKLGVYLSDDLKNVEEKSQRLQEIESDFHLAEVFDRWKDQGDLDLAILGTNLRKDRKAAFVEALLWRRFEKQVLTTNAPAQLESLIKTLQ